MTIPQGSTFAFTVTVMQQDSFLPQDLTNCSTATSTFKLSKLDTLVNVAVGTATITIADAVGGKLRVVLDSTMTNALEYARGEAEDNYYLKPVYQGILTIKFTDDTPERVAIIDKIRVAPKGV